MTDHEWALTWLGYKTEPIKKQPILDWNLAGEVLEKLNTDQKELLFASIGFIDDQRSCAIGHPKQGKPYQGLGQAETWPEAIIAAARKAHEPNSS